MFDDKKIEGLINEIYEDNRLVDAMEKCIFSAISLKNSLDADKYTFIFDFKPRLINLFNILSELVFESYVGESISTDTDIIIKIFNTYYKDIYLTLFLKILTKEDIKDGIVELIKFDTSYNLIIDYIRDSMFRLIATMYFDRSNTKRENLPLLLDYIGQIDFKCIDRYKKILFSVYKYSETNYYRSVEDNILKQYTQTSKDIAVIKNAHKDVRRVLCNISKVKNEKEYNEVISKKITLDNAFKTLTHNLRELDNKLNINRKNLQYLENLTQKDFEKINQGGVGYSMARKRFELTEREIESINNFKFDEKLMENYKSLVNIANSVKLSYENKNEKIFVTECEHFKKIAYTYISNSFDIILSIFLKNDNHFDYDFDDEMEYADEFYTKLFTREIINKLESNDNIREVIKIIKERENNKDFILEKINEILIKCIARELKLVQFQKTREFKLSRFLTYMKNKESIDKEFYDKTVNEGIKYAIEIYSNNRIDELKKQRKFNMLTVTFAKSERKEIMKKIYDKEYMKRTMEETSLSRENIINKKLKTINTIKNHIDQYCHKISIIDKKINAIESGTFILCDKTI
ncbi:hypothetical protein DLH72_04890 [Candidatus Gracilibacteria bacterium]|nr:MAG: hypothetical protein DLH72_04890 [Candidatus Gracilibacteria bacterium]